MRKKNLAYILIVVFVLCLSLIVVTTAYLAKNIDTYKEVMISEIEKQTGRELSLKSIEALWSFVPTITMHKVSFSNAPWGRNPKMFQADTILVKFSLLKLFRGELSVERIVLVKPEIYLETNAEAQGNWFFPNLMSDGPNQTSLLPESDFLALLQLHQVEIKDGIFSYGDGVTGENTQIGIDHFNVQRSYSGRMSEIDFKGGYQNSAILVKGKTTRIPYIFINRPYQIDLDIDIDDTFRAHLDGEIAQPLNLSGIAVDFEIKTPKASNLAGLFRQEWTLEHSMDISGRLTDREESYRFENLSVLLGQSDLGGEVDFVTSGKKLKLVAKLKSNTIKVEDFLEEIEPENQERFFSNDPFSFAGLEDLTADISLAIDQLLISPVPVKKVEARIRVEDETLVVEPMKGDIAEGSFGAELRVTNIATVPKLTLRARGENLNMGTILNTLISEEFLSGAKTDIDLELGGEGNSFSNVAATLNGHVLAVAGEGRIEFDLGWWKRKLAFDIVQQINPMVTEDNSSALSCAVIRFDVRDGQATSDKGLAFETDKIKILGSGTVDLKAEQMTLLLGSQSTVAKVLKVEGPLTAPQVGLASSSVVKEALSAGTAIITGGLSLVGEYLVDWTLGEDKPCEIALVKPPMEKSHSQEANP